MLPRACRSVAALSMMMGLAAASHASDWGTVPAISSTMGVHDGRVCVGEATRGDIGCPTYAPEVGTDGSISASRFVGDGSGLTGVVASTADRIVSGTTSLLAVSGTGFVSLTQAGTNTGWFDPTRGLVTLGVSSTGGISATTGYFANGLNVRGRIDLVSGTNMVAVGLNAGLNNTGADLTAMGYNAARSNTGANVTAVGLGAGQTNTGSNLTALGHSAAAINTGSYNSVFGFTTGQANTGDYVNAFGLCASQFNSGDRVDAIGYCAARYNSGGYVVAAGYNAASNNTGDTVNAMGTNAARTNSGSVVVAIGSGAAQYNTGGFVDALGYLTAISNTGSNVVAIGREAAKSNTFSNVVALGYNAQPDKANQIVLGNASIVEVSTAGVILARGVSTTGTVTATRFVGDGSGLTGVVASTADRIVSGTTSMVAVSSSGFVSLTQAGTNTGWFDPTRGLVTLGVSATGAVSATDGYFSRNVGIGTSAPRNSLEVKGTGIRLTAAGNDGWTTGLTTDARGTLNLSSGVGVGSNGAMGNKIFSLASNAYYIELGAYGHLMRTADWIVNSNSKGWSYNQPIIWSSLAGYDSRLLDFQGTINSSATITVRGLYSKLTDNSNNLANNVIGLSVDVGGGNNTNANRYAAILEGGRVGIGTATPQATLDVGGNVIVSSSAAAAVNVYGTVSATYVKLADNNNLPCTPERYGTLRFSNGIVSVCRAP